MNRSAASLIPALALAVLLGTAARLPAQSPTDANLGSTLAVDGSTTPATYTLSWWGKTGRHYVVETTPDLATWTFLPGYNPKGADAVLGIQFTSDADRSFFRVIQFDPADPGTLADSDSDGLPDKWELYHYGHLGRHGGETSANGLTLAQDYALGLNPTQSVFAGMSPTITVVSGSDQAPSPGEFLPKPLRVRVTRPNGTGWAGVPVRFTATAAEGLLSTDNSGTGDLSSDLAMMTDAQGYAQAWLQSP